MLVISGGDGSIGFSVEDSTGKNVIPENRASHRYFSEFRPDKKDSYVLLLDNGDDSAEKSVYWIVWAYYYNLVFLLLGAALSVAGIFTMYREERIISSKVKNTLEEACKIVKTSMNSRQISTHRGYYCMICKGRDREPLISEQSVERAWRC